MKKKILTLCMVVALVATAAIGGTLAYFTDTDDATNTFTVGNVQIDLTEPKWEEAGSKDAPEVYPGEALAKDPTVTNTGKNPCFVRISVTGWDSLAPAGLITYRTDYVANALGTDWVLHTDGYYYYTKVLAAGETTDALFDQIVIPTNLTNGYDGSYSLVVTAEAVQAQGAQPSWTAVQEMGVADIATWFGTCMAEVE
ncbi:MAG: SipW-dependent-type signal peptide-containing protein [Firmicutes bacterium]|nr:SipW-dependent-type signal peptide-containing protein [Bacillota bacterium]